jgi:3-phosphoglycerate kinase
MGGASERNVAMAGEQYGQTTLAAASLNASNGMTAKEAEHRLTKGLKMVSLQRRTIEEQIQHQRHDRALDRFKQQQHEWEKFREHASNRTGRYKEELVVTRAEEHRERKEAMELLDRATPDEVLSGGYSWYHSLRGEGSRFISVGNMFSGLHLPVKMHKENYVHEIVRKPHLQEIATHHRNLEAKGKKPRTWRDDEYLQARMRKYRLKMQEHAPGLLDVDELLEPTCIGLRPPGNYEFGDLGDCEGEDGQAEEIFAQDGDLSAVEQTMSVEYPEDMSPIATAELREGPNVQVSPEKLQFSTTTNKLNTQFIKVKNNGTAVIQYEWVLNEPQHGFQESCLPDDPTDRFVCATTKGLVLPGCETQTLFTFASKVPGSFTSSWRLSTYPELLEGSTIDEVLMHGVAVQDDTLLEQRKEFQETMSKQQVLRQVQELIDDVFDTVKLQPAPSPDLSAPLIQERLFEESNSSLGLYWSPHCWSHLDQIGGAIGRLRRSTQSESSISKGEASIEGAAGISQELSYVGRGRRPIKKKRGPYGVAHKDLHTLEGVPSVNRLEDELKTIVVAKDSEAFQEKREIAVELNRAVRAARERPIERNPLWWLAYETVLEIAKAVPSSHASARKSCELAPIPFLLPPAEDAPQEILDEYERQRQERDEKRGEKEKEEEATNIFSEAFANEQFGPQVAKFEQSAHQTRALTDMHNVASKTMLQRFGPYIGRCNSESVDINANVILYQVDLEFLSAFVHTPPAEDGSLNPPRPEFNLTAEAEELVRQRMAGIPPLLEVSPLAVIVVAHVGRATPEVQLKARETKITMEGVGEAEEDVNEFDVAPGMKSLPSLEPIADILASVTEGFASGVEFATHARWIGEAAEFAAQVRADTSDNKVFLLENMAAIPEEVGVKRFKKAEEEGDASTVSDQVHCIELSWAARETWARKVLKEISPEVFVNDSFTKVGQINTLSCGLWPGAPQKVVGQLVEGEMNGLSEALRFGRAGAKETEPPTPAGDGVPVPSPFLIVLGGGGYGASDGENALLQKLELLLGLAQLVEYEKDGVSIALGGELAVVILSCFLGVKLGDLCFKPSDLMLRALKDTLRDVLALGVTLLLPADMVAMKLKPPEPIEPAEVVEADPKAKAKAKGKAAPAPKAEERTPSKGDAENPAEEDGEKENKDVQSYSLAAAFAALAKEPVSLGFVQGKECFTSLNPEVGALRYTVGLPPPPPPPEPERKQKHSKHAPAPEPEVQEESVPEGPPLEVVPEGWSVRDIGDKTCEDLRLSLRRHRGVLWNGALGLLEEERFQKGTRTFLAHCGYRISGGGDDEEDEVVAVDEDAKGEDEDEDEGDDEEKEAKEEEEPEAEWETSLVIGRDSARMLPTLYDIPAPFAFESKSGETLLQIIRGKSLPGLLACAEKDRT